MSNMTNSIIGAGIIGQPYAMKQAGLLTGITLLIILTVVVDWTVRLIVIKQQVGWVRQLPRNGGALLRPVGSNRY